MAISSITASSAISSSSRSYHSYPPSKLSSFSSATQLPFHPKPNWFSHSRISSPAGPSRILPKVCRRTLPLLFLESVCEIVVSAEALFRRGRDPSSPVSAKKESFANLDELLQKSDKPVLVDFYATWCGPCQFMVPILEEVSSIMKDAVQVVKIDTEKYNAIASQYDIQALPTFILFKDGKPVDRFEGALPRDQLIQRIESSLNVQQS